MIENAPGLIGKHYARGIDYCWRAWLEKIHLSKRLSFIITNSKKPSHPFASLPLCTSLSVSCSIHVLALGPLGWHGGILQGLLNLRPAKLRSLTFIRVLVDRTTLFGSYDCFMFFLSTCPVMFMFFLHRCNTNHWVSFVKLAPKQFFKSPKSAQR